MTALTRLCRKLDKAVDAGRGAAIDASEANEIRQRAGWLLAEHAAHELNPSDFPSVGAVASLARASYVLRRKKREAPPSVYFVQHGVDGPIKIGRATNVAKRSAALQTGSPSTLILLASSSDYDEPDLHRFYRTEHIRGEWFRASPRLLAFIAYLNGGAA